VREIVLDELAEPAVRAAAAQTLTSFHDVVNRTGKETTIPSADVEEPTPTRLSPIPADFGVVIAEGDLYDLVAFLLAQARAAAAPGWSGSGPPATRSSRGSCTRSAPERTRARSPRHAAVLARARHGRLERDGRLDVICTEGWWEQPWRGEKLGLNGPGQPLTEVNSCCAPRKRSLCAGLLTPHQRLTEGLLPWEFARHAQITANTRPT
jgi:hypothetical protein